MGVFLFDQYSLLHIATGIIAYFWKISFPIWMVLHFAFEVVENTEFGMDIINQYIRFWPGGKNEADTFINSVGDQLSSAIGWLFAYYLDYLGIKYGWYYK